MLNKTELGFCLPLSSQILSWGNLCLPLEETTFLLVAILSTPWSLSPKYSLTSLFRTSSQNSELLPGIHAESSVLCQCRPAMSTQLHGSHPCDSNRLPVCLPASSPWTSTVHGHLAARETFSKPVVTTPTSKWLPTFFR